ncbi:hypothetical protein J6590_008565 [Homalodisca vitripennis]|nr:hypothetical protein J6590_008565 [Homalodisca vitripennis]
MRHNRARPCAFSTFAKYSNSKQRSRGKQGEEWCVRRCPSLVEKPSQLTDGEDFTLFEVTCQGVDITASLNVS